MVVAGGSYYPEGVYKSRQSRVFFSKNGKTWTAPRKVVEDGHNLYKHAVRKEGFRPGDPAAGDAVRCRNPAARSSGRPLVSETAMHPVEISVRAWLESVVIGLNLCPFASKPFRDGRVRVLVSEAKTGIELLTDLQLELARLADTPPAPAMRLPPWPDRSCCSRRLPTVQPWLSGPMMSLPTTPATTPTTVRKMYEDAFSGLKSSGAPAARAASVAGVGSTSFLEDLSLGASQMIVFHTDSSGFLFLSTSRFS